MDKNYLLSLIELKYNSYQIARLCGKGQTTIRYWLKKYGLKTNKDFDRSLTNRKDGNRKLPAKEAYFSGINWQEVQAYYDSGNNTRQCFLKFDIKEWVFESACKKGLIKRRVKKDSLKFVKRTYRHSEETKRKMSENQKKWLKDNPDKHPWRKGSKFLSYPCQRIKKILDTNDIKYAEELSDIVPGRFFRIDIAFPELKIGVEVNGDYHYNPDGTLKPYYQLRHDLIESQGWKLYELHCSIAYYNKEVLALFNSILKSNDKIEVKYQKLTKPTIKNIEPIIKMVGDAGLSPALSRL